LSLIYLFIVSNYYVITFVLSRPKPTKGCSADWRRIFVLDEARLETRTDALSET